MYTVRSEAKVFHFRIQRSVIGAYFVSDKVSFATLGELIKFYQNNSKSLGVPLEQPCTQKVGFSPHTHIHTYTHTHTNVHLPNGETVN